MQQYSTTAKLTVLSVLLLFTLTCVQEIVAQPSEFILSKRMTLHLKKTSVLQILSYISSKEEIPIGIELPNSSRMSDELDLDLDNATLEEVLNQIVQSKPQYRWRFTDGAINVASVTDQDVLIGGLLAIPIKSFEFSGSAVGFKLMDAVLSLPEVAQYLSAKGLVGERSANVSLPLQIQPTEQVQKFAISNVEFRTVLNKLIVETERKLWIASRSGERKTIVHILI